ncbi:hypothetical protein SAMN05192558_101106 [Actinokineospora alba]|uniref:Uncharacterized protein n=1 Tax=Actinokineospora alba TaxID=504798 RepID=A0A1H0EUI0_9PSEU|nr:hypothetical protein [Actinokineospora alba]TDP69229.1 hypothetical protein C8E96_4804 [Actinokineospora alba]SDI21465.1 hypothetical protein SAMN05421871_103763 [Actinokineospora alba]SDN86005.1 hypothetical protein SAMN05192558_101106 [Actinokineospora alba]
MRATVLTLLTVIGLLVLNAGPAAAGGPTSVLLTMPENQRAAALYHSDSAYTRLDGALSGGATASPQESNSYITATWLIHDVDVWRTDRIYLTPSGPVIETRTTRGTEQGIWDVPATWHTSSSPKELMALFASLGLTSGSSTARIAEAAAQPPAAPTPVEPVADVKWEWGIGGLIAGALLTVGAVLVRPRLRGLPQLSRPRPAPPLP